MLSSNQKETSKANIYYVKGVDQQLLLQHKNAILALFNGEPLPGSKVKKLNPYSIYRMRISDTKNKGRILFTYHTFSNIRSLLILEILEKHQYQKSKFLKKNVLEKFIETNQSQLEVDQSIQGLTEFKPIDLRGNKSQIDLEIGWIPVHSQNKDYLIFDEIQNAVLCATTPLIIMGDPGSGKTSLAVALWKQGINKNQKSLLITQSDSLVSNFEKDIECSPELELSKENGSEIVTYKTLLDGHLHQDSLNLQESKLLFKEWFLSIFKSINYRKNSGLIENQWYLIYQELRTISGYTKEKYTSVEGIGQKQGLFSNPKQRETLYYLFEAWVEYLKKKNLITCEFYGWDPLENERFDFVIIDEALDFSHAQLRQLFRLAKNANIVACIDLKQNLTDENPKYTYLKNLFSNNRQNLVVSEIQLRIHYRCPNNIMNLAVVFDQLRLQLHKKLKTEPKISRSNESGGIVKWITPNKVDEIRNLRPLNTDAHNCVITHPEYFEEVQSILHFKAYQIFTPLEAKGLQFRIVILYKILNSEVFYQVNEQLEALEKGLPPKDNVYCSAELSACFVACTRAKHTLLIIQEQKHTLRHITQLLANSIPAEPKRNALSEEVQVSTLDEWLEQAQALARQGQIEKSYKILEDIFGFDESYQKEGQLSKWGIQFPRAYPLEFEAPSSIVSSGPNKDPAQKNNQDFTAKKSKIKKKKKKSKAAKSASNSSSVHESQDRLNLATSEKAKTSVDSFLDMLHLLDESLNFRDFTHKCAEENNIDAQFYLGMRYLKGLDGYEEDPKQGFYWLKRAAELEHPEAILWIGNCFMKADGIAENQKLGFHWLLKAATLGLASAQYQISNCYFSGKGVAVDIPRGIDWCLKAAHQGYAEAQFNIGVSYQHGDGVPVDLQAAIFWYSKAAEQNYAEALINLSVCYSKGIGVAVNLEKSFKLCQKAASSGHPMALHNLAVDHQDGKGVVRNEQLAVSYFLEAANKGYADSQFALGKYYAFGTSHPPNIKQACYWFKLAADQGHRESQFNLGYFLVEGEGIDKNVPEGIDWLTKAAEQGDAKAQYNLATLYLSRPEIPQDKAKALYWLTKAAELGELRSLNRLGVCYMGEVELNLEKAIKYLTESVKDNDPNHQYNLGTAYYRNHNHVLAFKWILKAAAQGLKEAQYSVGMSYANAIGVKKDDKLAFEWLLKSAMQQFKEAQYELAFCYLRGNGVKSDIPLALKWFESSANYGLAEAQFMTGRLYEEEQKDLTTAMDWYSKAAKQGFIKAKQRLDFILKKLELEKLGKSAYTPPTVIGNSDIPRPPQPTMIPANPPILFQATTLSNRFIEEQAARDENESILETVGRKVQDNCTIC